MKALIRFAAGITLLAPFFVSAHAFGEVYTLPLPFSLYATGGVCALVASFGVLSLWSSPRPTGMPIRRVVHLRTRALEIILRALGVCGLALTIATGYFGSQDPDGSITPILFWVVLMLGVTYLSAIIGGIWRPMNPFETIVRCLNYLFKIKPRFQYPERFGYLPAIIFFYLLVWVELLSSGAGGVSLVLANLLVGYLFITIVGSALIGIDAWFVYADFFTVFFGLVSAFAPLQLSRGTFEIMPPGERLVGESADRSSLLFFILLMLASTAFDGLQDTQIWWQTFYQFAIQINFYTAERTILLILAPFVFLALYAAVIAVAKVVTRTRHSYQELSLRFAYSLIPIAIAYNIAHYASLFINEMIALIPMISDPFDKGWNLFGTAHYQVSLSSISPAATWNIQVTAIVLGHIIATYVAHRIAISEFDSKKKIILGQIPILILMVFYTVFGLWILSQGYQNSVS